MTQMKQKIFLTGGTGMVGNNIHEHEAGEQYIILSPTSAELDLTHFNSINSFLKQHKLDTIIHSAGLVGDTQANIKDPADFLVKGLQIGLDAILAVQQNSIKKLLNLASSCMYPHDMEIGLTEDIVLKGKLESTNEGHALAKVAATRLCEYMDREDKRWQYKSAIPCNLYGEYDKFNLKYSHMVPAVIKKIYKTGENNINEVEIWDDGLSRGEFICAGDLTDFVYYTLDHFDKMPQNLNVGLSRDCTINEYYQVIAKAISYEGAFIHDLSKSIGMKKRMIDNTRLIAFGWQPKTSLKEGIKRTLEYFKNTVLW